MNDKFLAGTCRGEQPYHLKPDATDMTIITDMWVYIPEQVQKTGREYMTALDLQRGQRFTKLATHGVLMRNIATYLSY